MKIKKIIFISTSIIMTLPIASVVSCASSKGAVPNPPKPSKPSKKTDRQKIDGITSTMIKNALNIKVDPNEFADDVQYNILSGLTINGLKDPDVTDSKWMPGTYKGTINHKVPISKGNLIAPKSPFNISLSGFKKITELCFRFS